MKFVLAPDSFKESMSAKEVCISMENGIKNIFKEAEFIHVPMADGGEGTMQSLVDATGGNIYKVFVHSPMNKMIEACFGILGNTNTAVIEMAEASGIQLVKREERNPLKASTYGTGELIKAALDKGVEEIIIGLGGSATNDGGAGMLQALGVKFLDDQGKELEPGGGNLIKLKDIDISRLDNRLLHTKIIAACDVENILCGENGASYVFGPQKGADEHMVKVLDCNLKHYADVVYKQIGKNIDNIKGAGAAGGLGAALLGFCNAELRKGIDIVIEYSGLEEKIENADYVFTGEGSIDFQTKFGKTLAGVAKSAKKFNVPVIALAGRVGEGIDDLYGKEIGIDAVFCIMQGACNIENALKDGKINVKKTSENIARLIKMK